MNKSEVIERLEDFKARLREDVADAYATRGTEFGAERFGAWRRQISKFLDENLPGASAQLRTKLQKAVFYRGRSETDLDVFIREDGNTCFAFSDSLALDVKNDEYEFTTKQQATRAEKSAKAINHKRVFIVHGHDELLLVKAARLVEQLGYEAVILHEQASRGMTIIEKIEANTDVGFAIVLYTADDKGNKADAAAKGELNSRARQNVVFEHGYLIAKLTRAKVVPLVSGRIELPSDISGMVYVDDASWREEIAKEMLAAGYGIDFNKLLTNKW